MSRASLQTDKLLSHMRQKFVLPIDSPVAKHFHGIGDPSLAAAEITAKETLAHAGTGLNVLEIHEPIAVVSDLRGIWKNQFVETDYKEATIFARS